MAAVCGICFIAFPLPSAVCFMMLYAETKFYLFVVPLFFCLFKTWLNQYLCVTLEQISWLDGESISALDFPHTHPLRMF